MKRTLGLLFVLITALCPLRPAYHKAERFAAASNCLSPAMDATDAVSDNDIVPPFDRGIRLYGRAVEYYRACVRVEKRNRGRIDMEQYLQRVSPYQELLVKLNNIDALLSVKDNELLNVGVRVPDSLIWFDALIKRPPQLDYYVRAALSIYRDLMRDNPGTDFISLKHQLEHFKWYIGDCHYRGIAVSEFEVKEILRNTTRAWAKAKTWVRNNKKKSAREKELLSQKFNRIKKLLDEVYNNLEFQKEAVMAERVFVHPHSTRSEIEEGKRRIEKQLRSIVKTFSPQAVAGNPVFYRNIHHVRLFLDTRGHREIYKFVHSRRDYVERETKGFVRISFIEDLEHSMGGTADFDNVRDRLEPLLRKYKQGRYQDVLGVFDVIYSHFVGLLFEMQGVEFLKDSMGYDLLAHGEEIYDADDVFLTELDAVLRDRTVDGTPESPVYKLCEIRSCRTPLEFETFMEERFYYKIQGFSSKKDFINNRLRELAKDEKAEVSQVLFMLDVGPNTEFIDKLISMEPELSRKYGLTVKFLFLNSSDSGLSIASRHNLETVGLVNADGGLFDVQVEDAARTAA